MTSLSPGGVPLTRVVAEERPLGRLPDAGTSGELRAIFGDGTTLRVPVTVKSTDSDGVLLHVDWIGSDEFLEQHLTLAWAVGDEMLFLEGIVQPVEGSTYRLITQSRPDRRAHPRYAVRVDATWKNFTVGAMRETAHGVVEDLSLEGLRLVTDKPIAEAGQVIVSVLFPDEEPFVVVGRIVRQPQELDFGRFAHGVWFGRLEPSQRDRFDLLMAAHSTGAS